MNIAKIKELQKLNGFTEIQNQINDGIVWKLEGSLGRYAMGLLESGACMLPKKVNTDAYGGRVPSRTELKQGTKGTWQNTVRFWQNVIDNGIVLNDGNIE